MRDRWARRTPEQRLKDRRDQWRWMIRRRFGLTPDDYYRMLAEQGGGCALCGRTPEENGRFLAIDHDHNTGRLRALLCIPCNTQVGTIEKNLPRLQAVLDYVNRYKT